MQTLKKLFESMGFGNVKTFIASGNVIFESSKRDPRQVERLVSSKLFKALGYEVHSFVRTREELQAVEAFRPFPSERLESAMAYHVGFATDPFGSERQLKIASLCTEMDDLRAEGSEIYWACQTRISDSNLTGAAIEKSVGGRATFRNINTVRRLLEKYPSANKANTNRHE